MRALVFCAAVVAVGCASGGKTKDVELSIGAAPDVDVSDADLASITSLDVAATGDAHDVMRYPLDRPLAKTERILMHFAAARGHVLVSVVARDAQGLVVLRGVSVELDLASDEHVAVVELAPPPAGMHSASGFNVAPAAFTLFTGQTVQLTGGDEAVSWSDEDGGAIDEPGTFTAPSTAGIYHATATSKIYPTTSMAVELKVLASGVVRYAGLLGGSGTVDGTGASARVDQPRGLVLQGDAVYFADAGDEIRRLDPATGAVTTVAGKPDYNLTADGTGDGAAFAGPNDVVGDGYGTLYVAEGSCPCIRAVNVANGKVTTLAGAIGMHGAMDGTGAAAQFDWPQSLAIDPAKHLLYVGDNISHTVRTVETTSGKVTTIAGVAYMNGSADGPAASATFSTPTQLVFDGSALYIWDPGTSRIRKLDLGTMMVSTVASSVNTALMTPAGAGTLLLSQPVRLFHVADGSTTRVVTSDDQDLNEWYNSIVAAPDGSFYAAAISSLAHLDLEPRQPDWRGAMTTVAGFEPSPPWTESDGPRSTARLDSLIAIAARSDGTLWARDNRIRKIDASGTVTSVAGDGGSPIIQWDGGMTFAPDGMLYACDRGRHMIVRIDVDHGGTVTSWAGTPDQYGFADGTLAAARFNQPSDIASDGGKLYVSDSNNHVIRVIDIASGMVSTLAGAPGQCGLVDMPGSAARFCGPQGLVADGDGNLYVGDNNAIRKIVIASGDVSQFVKNNGLGFVDGPSGTAKMWGPFRLAFDAAKKYLYFSDQGNDAVRRVEMATATVSSVAGGPGRASVVEGDLPGSINQPGALAFGPTGELFVAVPRENAIVQIRLP